MKIYESKRPIYEALALAALLFAGGIYGYTFMQIKVIACVSVVVSGICIAISIWRLFVQNYIEILDNGFSIHRGKKSEFYDFSYIQSIGIKTIERKKNIQLLAIKFKKAMKSPANLLIFVNENEALMDGRYASIHQISKILNEKLQLFNVQKS